MQKIKKNFFIYLENTFPASIINFLRIFKNIFCKKIENRKVYVKSIKGLQGVEIGGPSNIFKYKIPLYASCASLEFVNFASYTPWEGYLSYSTQFYKNKIGKQHIAEATKLPFSDIQFDFVLSSNCLEHVANPIKALKEWKRIAKKNIILLVPRKDNSFDHKRSVTSFDHLMNDFNNDVAEDDLTHLNEILSLHDLDLDPQAGSAEEFKQRSLNNFKKRCLHHHVFDEDIIKKICHFLNMNIVESTVTKSDYIFLISINR